MANENVLLKGVMIQKEPFKVQKKFISTSGDWQGVSVLFGDTNTELPSFKMSARTDEPAFKVLSSLEEKAKYVLGFDLTVSKEKLYFNTVVDYKKID